MPRIIGALLPSRASRARSPSAPSLGADVHTRQHWPVAAAFSRRGPSFVAFGRKIARSQSLESLSGHGSGGGLAGPVLHAGERRPRDFEPFGARICRRAGTAEPVRRVCDKRRLLRLRERETHTFPETLVPSHRPDHLATQGLADKGGPSRSPRSVVEPRGRRNRRVVVG